MFNHLYSFLSSQIPGQPVEATTAPDVTLSWRPNPLVISVYFRKSTNDEDDSLVPLSKQI